MRKRAIRMLDTTIILIGEEERYQDKNGIWRTGEAQRREVFAQVASVDRREFFSGGESGLRPEFQFTLFAAEYQGEALCEYNGKTYAIYRTYHVPDTDYLELYVQRKVGVKNGK